MQDKILIDENLLLEIKKGILEAIYHEDGLDGADGTYLLSGINLALGLSMYDHNLMEFDRSEDELVLTVAKLERLRQVCQKAAEWLSSGESSAGERYALRDELRRVLGELEVMASELED